jgi:hypothetical protein
LPNVSQSPAPIVYSDSVRELGRKEIVDRLFILDQFRSGCVELILGHRIAPSSDDSIESFAAKCVKVGDWTSPVFEGEVLMADAPSNRLLPRSCAIYENSGSFGMSRC